MVKKTQKIYHQAPQPANVFMSAMVLSQTYGDSMTSSHVNTSPSSSLVKDSKTFDAFISHAGEQKQSLALFLYEELTRSDANSPRDLNPFLDEVSIPKGSDSHHVMDNAMQTAPIGVFVLSPEFAFKKWPMKELKCFLDRADQQKQQQEMEEETQQTASAFGTNDDKEATKVNAKNSYNTTTKNTNTNSPSVVPSKKKRPMPVTIIPIFYELSWEDCNLNKNAFWDKYGHHSTKFQFAQRVERQEVSLDSVLDILHRVSIISGVRNEKGEHQIVLDVTKRIHELWDEYHGVSVPKKSAAKWYILGTIVLLLIVVLTVTLTLLVGAGSDDPGVQLTAAPATPVPTNAPTEAPTISIQNREWVQIGLDVMDNRATYAYGDSLALSQDGQTMVVGDPGGEKAFIFRYDSMYNRWNPWGEALKYGSSSFDSGQFGHAVDISASGSIVAIGARYHNAGDLDSAGQVVVYEYTNSGTKWQQLGSEIIGQSANDRLGSSISLSSDGRTVACGGDNFLAIYRYDGLEWEPFGNNNAHVIPGKSGIGGFGSAVAVSGDGNRVLAGGYHMTENFVLLTGYVRVYELMPEAQEWYQVSNEINGPAQDPNFALDLALSGDGKTFAVSGYEDDEDGSGKGYVQVYFQQDSSGKWISRGERLVGETRGGLFGESVALSDNGLIVAVGDSWSNNGESQSGAVYLYFWNADKNIWDSLGKPIAGQSRNDQLGLRVALDQNGTQMITSNSYSQDNDRVVRAFDFPRWY